MSSSRQHYYQSDTHALSPRTHSIKDLLSLSITNVTIEECFPKAFPVPPEEIWPLSHRGHSESRGSSVIDTMLDSYEHPMAELE